MARRSSPGLERERDLSNLNFRSLTRPVDKPTSYLTPMRQKADAVVSQFHPLTVEQRFGAFKRLAFRPYGLFVPSDKDAARDLQHRLRWEVGEIQDQDERLDAYFALQDETESWKLAGIPGTWGGQQGIARSSARFRVAGMGRGAGKTYYAAHECLAVALAKPRSTIWVCAPTHLLVSRCFDIIARIVKDFGFETDEFRNSQMYRRIVLSETGSKIEGVSLENVMGAAGDTVDFALVDEAAQLYEEAWNRAVAPPLARREGQALIISSWEGQEGFFYEQVEKAKALEEEGLWQVFSGVTWDNIFQFPQGRDSAAIKHEERWLSAAEFLEQYGARPMGTKNLIYPEFHELIHVKEEADFDPTMPIQLAVDPSGGANEYAVAAVQDYGDIVNIVEEFYAVASAEDAMRWVKERNWAENVGPCIFDSAWPADIMRWQRAGFQAFGVPNKPEPGERYPVWRHLLRDPLLFAAYRGERLQEALDTRGISLEEYDQMSIADQAPIMLEVEESIMRLDAGTNDIQRLRDCSHLFIHPRCKNLIWEHKRYAYKKTRGNNGVVTEKPVKKHDHLLDATGYWAWHYKRYDFGFSGNPNDTQNFMQTVSKSRPSKSSTTKDKDDNLSLSPTNRGGLWLEQMRDTHRPSQDRSINTLRYVR